jgi:hypothetical protein
VNTGDPEGHPKDQDADYQLLLHPRINNNPKWDAVSPSQPRDVHLTFDYWETREVYEVRATGQIFNHEYWAGRLPKPRAKLIAAIDQCLNTWQQKVAYRQDAVKSKLFQNRWDFSGPEDQDLLDVVWLDIARAGEALTKVLFWGGDEGLDEIRERLLESIAAPRDLASPMLLTIHSDDLFAPWWMLYTTPDDGPPLHGPGSAYQVEGFWGYKHLVEHQTKRNPYTVNATKMAGPQVRTGLNVDPNIDQSGGIPFVRPVTTFLQNRATQVTRELKEDLTADFLAGTFTDEITYFGCHCTTPAQGAPYLKLRDGEPITAADMDSWLPGQACLKSRPVVFINACQGGKMSSLFFESFGTSMLAKGANCVIGPQIDMPVLFAAEYATRLFGLLLMPGQRLGEIVLELTREFATHYRNPLGLTYSLYRGVDVYLSREDSPPVR